ncbi:MAG: hypothetical protein K8T89_09400, partial [Planctomycetes bacterium]|nr:hypothetical protein [Planctomycetota bacterium]
MAAKIDAQLLKKHHFWFLFIPIGFFFMLAWFGILSEVDDEVSATILKNDNEKKKVAPVKAQAKKTIDEYKEQLKVLDKQRDSMCRQGWAEQKKLFVWPAGYKGEQPKVFTNLKFGDNIANKQAERNQFPNKDIYKAEYETLVKSVQPMQFKDGWEKVLRHVGSWGPIPTSEDMWLAMEDLWVERSVLLAINQINVNASK